jgi:uncharacterized surface protein with fasciclin (FAS1) repeats
MFGSRVTFVAPALLAGTTAFGMIAATLPTPLMAGGCTSTSNMTAQTVSSTRTIQDKTIPSVAVGSGRLDTLVAAVKFAGLAEALSGEGPFTVFAPTDEAFGRVDSKTLESLLTPAGRPTLQRILKHHVVAGEYKASDLVGRDSIETLAGTSLELDAVRGRLLVADSVVETADVDGGNGVVHLIDRVLLPPPQVEPLETLLDSAVGRGAPLFNDGDPGSCAAVYATALEAVSLAGGFGLDAARRAELGAQLEEIGTMEDPSGRAWAYRRIIDALFEGLQNGSIVASMTEAPSKSGNENREASAKTDARAVMTRGKVLFSFEENNDFKGWNTVLDGVMGGRSTGRITKDSGVLVFDGKTSLENNGGFSSIRTNITPGFFDGADAIRLVVKGDGRDYKLGVKSYRGRSAEGYWRSFPTVAGEWTEVVIPIADFQRQFMGQIMRGSVSGKDIQAVEFYIYDKKAGPFKLEVDSISAVKNGDLAFDA